MADMKIGFAFALIAVVPADLNEGPPIGMNQASPSDFDFAAARDSPCVWRLKDRRAPDRAFAEACKQWSDPQYFHGVWSVGFEESNFTFMGKMDCYKMQDHSCIELRGEALPWPSRSDCNREFELKFIGRRSRYAIAGIMGSPTFAVTVDRVIYARRLPAPYNWVCPGAPEDEND
jgi:hypothetical protein